MKNQKAFTLVELIIVVSIIAILSTIGTFSYIGYLGESRDAQRKSSMSEINSALKLYKQKYGSYPIPGNNFNIINGASNIVAKQGVLNKSVTLDTMNNLPTDPQTETFYSYSVTENKQESQVAMTLENEGNPIALLKGDYKSVSKYVLPNIVLAIDSTTDIDITVEANRNKFLVNEGTNLTYSMESPYSPVYDGSDIDTVLDLEITDFWQNSSFRTCTDISNAAKDIGNGQYQVLNDNGVLTGTGCTFP